MRNCNPDVMTIHEFREIMKTILADFVHGAPRSYREDCDVQSFYHFFGVLCRSLQQPYNYLGTPGRPTFRLALDCDKLAAYIKGDAG